MDKRSDVVALVRMTGIKPFCKIDFDFWCFVALFGLNSDSKIIECKLVRHIHSQANKCYEILIKHSKFAIDQSTICRLFIRISHLNTDWISTSANAFVGFTLTIRPSPDRLQQENIGRAIKIC